VGPPDDVAGQDREGNNSSKLIYPVGFLDFISCLNYSMHGSMVH
jgi:hypothetical protein